MLPPDQDVEDRRPLWDVLQTFWMDTNPAPVLADIARVCASSKYSVEEIEAIFWNEVRPAVSFNLFSGIAPEWAGFEIGWLTERILRTNRFGEPVPLMILRPAATYWWVRLRDEIGRQRSEAH